MSVAHLMCWRTEETLRCCGVFVILAPDTKLAQSARTANVNKCNNQANHQWLPELVVILGIIAS